MNKEQLLYEASIPILQKASELYKEDENKAVEYIIDKFKEIEKQIDKRLEYEHIKANMAVYEFDTKIEALKFGSGYIIDEMENGHPVSMIIHELENGKFTVEPEEKEI